MDAARIEHPVDARADEDGERQEEVDHLALARFLVARARTFTVLGGDEELLLVLAHGASHRAVVASRPDDEYHEREREECVKVERYRLQKEGESVDAAVLRKRGADCRRPTRDGRDDADGRRRGIDDVRELCTRDLEFIRYGTHDRTDGETVEIVVDEDDDAEQCCQHQCAALALNRARRPLAIRTCRARARDRRDEDAEDREEYKDVHVRADLFLHH